MPSSTACPYQLFIRFEIACFFQTLFQKLTATLRDRPELALAIMALRHQLVVLERSGLGASVLTGGRWNHHTAEHDRLSARGESCRFSAASGMMRVWIGFMVRTGRE